MKAAAPSKKSASPEVSILSLFSPIHAPSSTVASVARTGSPLGSPVPKLALASLTASGAQSPPVRPKSASPAPASSPSTTIQTSIRISPSNQAKRPQTAARSPVSPVQSSPAKITPQRPQSAVFAPKTPSPMHAAPITPTGPRLFPFNVVPVSSPPFARTPPADSNALEPVRPTRELYSSLSSTQFSASLFSPMSQFSSTSPMNRSFNDASLAVDTCKAVLQLCAQCCKGPASSHVHVDDPRRRAHFVTDEPLLVCTHCRSAYFCSQACQRAAWKWHRAPCAAARQGLVAAVEMRNAADCKQVFIRQDDPRIDSAVPSAVMQRCGIPLAITPLSAGRDNECCHMFMMDPITGALPAPFRSLGCVLVVRQDRMPVTPQHIHQLGEYFTIISERFEDDDDADAARALMHRDAFARFLSDHVPFNGKRKYTNEVGVSW